jgi:hypothetical protein
MSEPEQLRQVVETVHSCRARLVSSVPVLEKFRQRVVWDGPVHVFQLDGHLAATRAYAWFTPIDSRGDRRFYAVLHLDLIRSPVDAVRVVTLAEHRQRRGVGKGRTDQAAELRGRPFSVSGSLSGPGGRPLPADPVHPHDGSTGSGRTQSGMRWWPSVTGSSIVGRWSSETD